MHISFFILLLLPFINAWTPMTSLYPNLRNNNNINEKFETYSILYSTQLVPSGSAIYSTPTFDETETKIFYGSYDYKIYSVFINGTLDFVYSTNGQIRNPITLDIPETASLTNNKYKIYFSSDDGFIYCMFTNGTIYFKYNSGSSGLQKFNGYTVLDKLGNSYTPSGSIVIVLDYRGNLKTIINGTISNAPTGLIYSASVNPNGNLLYLNSKNGMYVFSTQSNSLQWSIKMNTEYNGRFFCFDSNSTIYYTDGSSNFMSVFPNGTIKWTQKLSALTISTPVLSADEKTLYFGSEDNFFRALSSTTGETIYSVYTPSQLSSSASLSPDTNTIYLAGWNGILYAFNAIDGSTKWKLQMKGDTIATPIVSTNGRIISVGTLSGNIYIVKSHCPAKIYNCETSTNGCNTYESVNNCPFGNCTTGYYNNDAFKKCTVCPINCNADQIKTCDSNGGNTKCKNTRNKQLWSTFVRNSIRNDFIMNYTVTRVNQDYDNMRLEWIYRTNDAIKSGPVIDAYDNIYLVSFDNNVYSLTNDGILRWKTEISTTIVYSTPSLSPDDKYLYIITPDGNFYSIFTNNGTIYIQKNFGSADYTVPAVSNDGNYIYFVVNDKSTLYCIDKKGNTQWTYQTTSTFAYSVVLLNSDNSIIYFVTYEGTINGLNKTGNLIFQSSVGIGPSISLSPDSKYLYSVDFDRNLNKLDAKNGTNIWSKNYKIFYWNCVSDYTYIYCSAENFMYAFKVSDGTIFWSFDGLNIFVSPPIISPDRSTIYGITINGNLYALHTDGAFKFVQQIKNPDNPEIGISINGLPALSNDGFNIYIGNDNGIFYSVRIDCPNGNNCESPSYSCNSRQEIDICFPRKCVKGYFNDLYKPSLCSVCPAPENCKYSVATSCNYDGTNSLCQIGMCKDGFFNNETVVCQICPPPINCKSIIASKCFINGLNPECPLGLCYAGFYNLPTTGYCFRCPPAYKCTTFSESCDATSGKNSSCPVGKCEEGYFNNQNNRVCELCSPAPYCKVNYTIGCNSYGNNSICPQGLCNDGFYNEGINLLRTYGRVCMRCPKPVNCKVESALCGPDGQNSLCPADKCDDGFTNSGVVGSCILKPQGVDSMYIGIAVAVGVAVFVIAIALYIFRDSISKCMDKYKTKKTSAIVKICFIIILGIILPLSSIYTDISAFISFMNRAVNERYGLLEIYIILIAISCLVTGVSVLLNFKRVFHDWNMDDTEVESPLSKMYSEAPGIIQMFLKNLPMVVMNTLIIMNDSASRVLADKMIFVTIPMNGITFGGNISSAKAFMEAWSTYKNPTYVSSSPMPTENHAVKVEITPRKS